MFRVAYGTITAAGTLTIMDSIEPTGMPSLTGLAVDLSAAPEYLDVLQSFNPVRIESVCDDPRIAPLLHAIQAGVVLNR